jgi:hypothetical protein
MKTKKKKNKIKQQIYEDSNVWVTLVSKSFKFQNFSTLIEPIFNPLLKKNQRRDFTIQYNRYNTPNNENPC